MRCDPLFSSAETNETHWSCYFITCHVIRPRCPTLYVGRVGRRHYPFQSALSTNDWEPAILFLALQASGHIFPSTILYGNAKVVLLAFVQLHTIGPHIVLSLTVG